MGIFDKAKDLAAKHSNQVDQGIEKAGDEVDERTAGKYSTPVDKGQKAAGEYLTEGQAQAEKAAHEDGNPV